MYRFTLFPAIAALTAESALCDTPLIPAGSNWRHLDDGTDQDTLWAEVEFDDMAWSAGPAQLGYGDDDEATVVSFGPDPAHKFPTTYFKRVFTIDDPAAYDVIRLAPSLFLTGSNLLAVEVHQVSDTSSDLGCDLELVGLSDWPDPFEKAPHLIYSGDPTAMKVVWQLKWTTPATIEWGETSDIIRGWFETAETDARYWSFDYGPAHFAIVDQYAVEEGLGPAQLAWLDADLAATYRPWKFVVLHESGWSAGGHEPNVEVQTLIWPLCMVHDVAMVFAGHNHYYARADVNGIQHITIGGGGAPLRQIDPAAPHVVTAASAYHFCKIEIIGDQLFFDAVAPDGTIIDSFRRSTPTSVDPLTDEGVAPSPRLDPAFPNPFNAATTIAFSLPETRTARLTIHDPAGRLVRTLVDQVLPAGSHRIAWDGRSDGGHLAGSGVYLYTLVSGDIELSGRIVMIK